MKKLLFVYNPHSGTGTIPKYLSEILTILTAGGYDVTVHPTAAPLDGQNYIMENGRNYDIIVSGGGDGMLHELINAVISSDCGKPCGYIPAGTVNDYAGSLGIPKDIARAAHNIVNGEFISVDAGKFGEKYFSYIAAFGMFTDVSYSTDQKVKNIFGAAAYLMNAVKSLDLKKFNATSSYMTITAENGEELSGDFIFGLCGNTYSVGGLQNVVPYNADMQDGLLDGLFIRTPRNPLELQSINFALLNRKFDDCEFITCMQSHSFTIRSEKNIAWTLDGEEGGTTTEVTLSAVKAAYEIAVPPRVTSPLRLIPEKSEFPGQSE